MRLLPSSVRLAEQCAWKEFFIFQSKTIRPQNIVDDGYLLPARDILIPSTHGVYYSNTLQLVHSALFRMEIWWQTKVKWNSDGLDKEEITSELFKPASCYLSVVLPAYNEEKRLAACLKQTMEYLKERQDLEGAAFTYEIIVVDDGSVDKTLNVVEQFQLKAGVNELRVIKLSSNKGKGFAVKMGMHCSRGKFLLMADSDGATRFSDIARLEKCMIDSKKDSKEQPACIIFGSRKNIQEEGINTRRVPLRKVMMFFFRLFLYVVIGTTIQDTQCGFKLFDRNSARWIFTSLHLSRWAFDTEIVYIANMLGMRIIELAVDWTEIPGSKVNLLTAPFQMARDILLTRALYCSFFWQPKDRSI
ncbi:dolichol-phosphate-mannose synthase family protein [Cardiosporidium cionae]|uniref:dolichyl-phosphate beta-glucosyltransferase n=1 Tax=Cardiosporidium cionae TaxID=476202 RepID=A0ABQ7J7N4_9APIC|nr:dolichol-phosphate-mannose synthase family protein [Cardiosporidium cionae]|eukprot:KAF8819997.1 dolichol-phosphate-mannose synthase family protein [Cardiosporidium cionae]